MDPPHGSTRGSQQTIASGASRFAPTSPQKSTLHHHHFSSARTSPRQVKFVEPLALPGVGNAGGALRWCSVSNEAMAANFRNELFQFHQLLRDAVEAQAKHRAIGTSDRSLQAPQLPFLYNRKLFELLTSDRGDVVLQEFFRQWKCMKADALDEQQLLMWDVLDTLVTHLPVVIPEAESTVNAKSVFRYLDALKSLQKLLANALYKLPNTEPAIIEDDEEEEQQQYSFLRKKAKAKKPNAPTRAARKLPLPMYCQKLEEELDTLRVRLANVSDANSSPSLHMQDLGLLKDQTVTLLLRFWDLPKTERLGFFCQIASQTSEDDAALILSVFLERGTTQNLIRVWELLQRSPQLRNLFAKKSSRSAKALGDALEDAETHDDPKDDATQTELAHSDSDTAASGPHRKERERMSQLAHLNGITDVFEADERDNELSDEVADNKRRSGRKLRIRDRERGHSPSNERGHSEHQHQHHRHGERNIASPPSLEPQETLERLHQLLLAFVKEESKYKGSDTSKSSATPVVVDAAWRLLELVDPKNAAKMPHHHAPNGGSMAHAATQPLIHRPDAHSNLRPDQQYMMKFDQLQALLTSINTFQPQTMPPDVTTAVFHRMDGVTRAFNEFCANAVSAATGENVDSNACGSSALELTDAMQLVLSKFGKVVRNFAPLAANSNGMDQAAVMKLADALEGQDDCEDSSFTTQRSSMQDMGKRTMIMKRLRALTTCGDLDNLFGMIESACDEFTTLREQQLAMGILPLMSSSERKKYRRDGMLVDGAGVVDEDAELADEDAKDGDADEVSRIVKDAKSRRASIAAAKAMKLQQQQQQQQDADQDADSDSVYPSRYSGRDIQSSYKQSARGIKLFNVAILLRVIDQMYRENYESMVSSLQYGNRRMEFSDFVYDWHIRKYGLKALAQQHLLKFIQSLRKYDKKTFQCNLALGFHEHKFVLSLLDKWSLGTFSGTSKHRIESTPRQFKIRVTFALTTLQEAFSERFGVYFRSMDSITARIKAQASRAPDDEFIQESELLEIAVDEWLQLRNRIEQILEAVYVAGDLNGDGNLEYDEFAAVISHLTPTMDEKALQRVFTAAHDHIKPRRISFERFIDVILLERVLGTTPVKSSSSKTSDKTMTSSNSSGNVARLSTEGVFSRTSMEEEESYQFNLLQETWEIDRESVAAVLRGITHQQTAASLTFRVAFLTQILSKRVDSKTAWMCHRQIMREISRYQNLNEDQIVVLKSKEETFKKAVQAIRRMQRFGLVLSSVKNGTASSLISESQDPQGGNEDGDGGAQQLQAPSLTHEHDANRYTSVVEQTLAQPPHEGAATMNDMIALEEQLREQFLMNADADGIEDFKSALQQIRHVSLHNFSLGLTHEQLETLSSRPTVESIGEEANEEDEDVEDDLAEEDA